MLFGTNQVIVSVLIYFLYIYNKNYDSKWSCYLELLFSSVNNQQRVQIKTFNITIQRATGISACCMLTSLSQSLESDLKLDPPEQQIKSQVRRHEASRRRRSALWHRAAQRDTSRGTPNDSDTAREPEDVVSTGIHVCREQWLFTHRNWSA